MSGRLVAFSLCMQCNPRLFVGILSRKFSNIDIRAVREKDLPQHHGPNEKKQGDERQGYQSREHHDCQLELLTIGDNYIKSGDGNRFCSSSIDNKDCLRGLLSVAQVNMLSGRVTP